MKRRKFLFTTLSVSLLTVSVSTACNAGGNAGDTTADSGKKTLVLATSADYPPYEFVDSSTGNQEIIGFDIDVAKYITNKLGYGLRVDNIDFNGLIPALQAQRADLVMAGMTPTDERKQNADFSQLYYEAKNTIIAKKGSGLTTLDSLAGKTVGVQLGSTQEQRAKDIKGANVQRLNRVNEIIQELKTGRIEAAIVEDTIAKGYSASNPDLEFNLIPNIPGRSGSAIAFPKGSPLVAQFDPIIAEMKNDGTMEELIVKWFGENSPANQQAAK